MGGAFYHFGRLIGNGRPPALLSAAALEEKGFGANALLLRGVTTGARASGRMTAGLSGVRLVATRRAAATAGRIDGCIGEDVWGKTPDYRDGGRLCIAGQDIERIRKRAVADGGLVMDEKSEKARRVRVSVT